MAKTETKVTVNIVPTKGETQTKQATVPKKGATVKDALASTQTRTTNVDIQVNGKPATLETGAVIQVPFFVDQGDIVRVDTRTSVYLDRIKRVGS